MTPVLLRGRALLRRRWRAWAGLGFVLGVFSGVALALAQGARATDLAYPRFVRAQRAADLVLAGGNPFGFVGSIDLQAVERRPGVVDSANVFAAFPFSGVVDGARTIGAADMLPVASVDTRLGTDIERWKMLDGRRADPARADEATASFELAHRLHLKVGSTIRFHFYDAKTFGATAVKLLQQWPGRLDALARGRPGGTVDAANGPFVNVRVVGIEASPLEFPPLLTEVPPILHLSPAFNAAYSTKVVGSPAGYIRLDSNHDLKKFQLDVENLAHGRPVSFISTLANQQPKVQRSIRAEALVLGVLAGLVALATAIALAQALARQALTESRDDDTLRALGMDRRQMIAIAMVRALFIAVVAVVVAVLVGWRLAPSMLLSLAAKANLQHGYPVDAMVLVVGGLAVAVFTLLVGALVAWFLVRTRRPAAPDDGVRAARRVLGEPGLRSRLPLPTLLGIRFALQRVRHSAPAWSAILGIALCIAMLVSASTFTEHLQRGLSDRERHGWNWGVKIGAPALPDIADNLVPSLRKLPGLTDLSVGGVTQVDITQTRIDVLALDPIVGDAQPTLVAGRSPRAADEIALGARTMREKSTGLGRLIEAKIGDNAATYRVVGQVVFPEFGDSGQLGTGAQMTVAGVRRLLPTAPRDNFYLRFSGRDAVARQDDVAAILNPLPAHTDARPEDLVNLARGDGLLLVLGGLLGLLALAMLVHTVVTAVRSARRSHAVLRALGYSRRQSEATVLWQSLALAVAALGVGLPAGLVVGRWVWIAYANHLGMPSDPYVPSISVVLALVGTTVVALLAAAAPGWIVARTNVARTLHAPD